MSRIFNTTALSIALFLFAGAAKAYTFTNVTSDHTIHANFAIDTFVITASASNGGSVAPVSEVINYGSDLTVLITPDAGYHVLDVLVDGVSVGPINSYTFTNITSGHTLEASFATQSHVITATAGPGGSILPNGPVSVVHGDNATFTITPNTGYHVLEVLVDGMPVGEEPAPPDTGFSSYSNSMPGDWRPFSDDSPWNIPLDGSLLVHPLNDGIMSTMTRVSNIRFAASYLPAFWVVDNSDNFEKHFYHSSLIYDYWDCCPQDGISDIAMPIVREMYPEPTSDGHIIIYDKKYDRLFECSRFNWPDQDADPSGTTFNVWDATARGYAFPDPNTRWQLRGGRGSGVPVIGGLIRPEELESGIIRHALAFTFGDNRAPAGGGQMFISPPAARSDGKLTGEQYPIEGMRFQLDPNWDASGLLPITQIVAQALKDYGAFVVDNGGDWAMQLQLLGPTASSSRSEWDSKFPGFYNDIQNIPTSAFRVIYTGEPTILN